MLVSLFTQLLLQHKHGTLACLHITSHSRNLNTTTFPRCQAGFVPKALKNSDSCCSYCKAVFFPPALTAKLSWITIWQPLMQRSHSSSCSVGSPCSTRWWVPVFSWPHLWYGSSWTGSFLEEGADMDVREESVNHYIHSWTFFPPPPGCMAFVQYTIVQTKWSL